MSSLVFAGLCIAAAQVLGIYALVTRKADLIFALIMAVLLVLGIAVGGVYAYHRIH